MRKMTFMRLITLTITTLGLIACGGGDPSVSEPVAVKPELVPANLKLTQVPMVTTITPGETIVVARLTADCLTHEGTDACKIQVPIGEIGLDFDIEITDIKLLYNGQVMPSYFNREIKKGDGNLYRILPTQLFTIWQKGVIEVTATVSPYAKTGEKTAVVVHVADASFDKTLELVASESKVGVLELQHLAPAVISNASPSAVTNNGNLGEVAHFDVTCPITVVGGCSLSSFDMTIFGSPGGAEVQIHIDGNWYAQYYTSGQGNDFFGFSGNYPINQGQTVTVRISVAMTSGSVYIQNIKTTSGGVQIAPQLDRSEKSCESVITGANCKG